MKKELDTYADLEAAANLLLQDMKTPLKAADFIVFDEAHHPMRLMAHQMQMMEAAMVSMRVPMGHANLTQLAVRGGRRQRAVSIRSVVDVVRNEYAVSDYNTLHVLSHYDLVSDSVSLQQLFDIAHSCRFAALSQGTVIGDTYAVQQANCYWRAMYTLSQTVSHDHYPTLHNKAVWRIRTFDYADMKINHATRLFFRTGDDILDD